MIYPARNILFEKFFRMYTKRSLKKTFHRIHLSGLENFTKRKAGAPVLFFANHSNWWDGFVCFYITKEILHTHAFYLMEEAQMKKYSLFKWLGVFSVNRNNAFEAYKSLQFIIDLMKKKDSILWMFPQGKMIHNDLRPLIFEKGIDRICKSDEKINFIPVVFSYEFLMEERPEVFVKIMPSVAFSGSDNRLSLTEILQNILTSALDSQKSDVVRGNLNSYNTVLSGKRSRNKLIDSIYGD